MNLMKSAFNLKSNLASTLTTARRTAASNVRLRAVQGVTLLSNPRTIRVLPLLLLVALGVVGSLESSVFGQSNATRGVSGVANRGFTEIYYQWRAPISLILLVACFMYKAATNNKEANPKIVGAMLGVVGAAAAPELFAMLEWIGFVRESQEITR